MRCETVRVRVLGMVCDAGGNNAHMYKLQDGHLSLPEGGWLELRYVQVKNPWDTSRSVCVFYCSPHVSQTMRNVLLVSWFQSGKNMFLSSDNIKISFQVIVNYYYCDKQRVTESGAPLTRLNQAAVKPNKWLK